MSAPLLSLLAGRRGHFQMESGYHSELWFDLDALFADSNRLQPYAHDLAHRLAAHRPHAVCGPMTGGAKLAAMIGAALGIASYHTERFAPPDATGLFPVKYLVPTTDREKLRGKSVAIVDDAISAGSAVKGTYADLLACGARPVALGALFIFGDAAAAFAAEKNLPLVGLARMSFGLWHPDDCPLCRAGLAVEVISDTST